MTIPLDQGAKWAILLLAALQANESAYRVLLKELNSYLQKFLRKRLKIHSDIDDLIQEILMGVHHARHTYDGTRPFLPWFHAIVRYKTIDALRSKKRVHRSEILDEEAFENYFETFEPPDANQSLDEDVLQALAALPPKQRRAVELMKLQGLSAKEAGARMGMSEAATKVSAHRAYTALRKRFRGNKK
ncbi:MAG: sigma-70 family RNA polymerase sigma factor [Pseudobdellovibrionaceae bacterium]|nr:sigma-70 family RNA polymerase sigma factor [Pseudobdellovibrionaceae bacterium]